MGFHFRKSVKIGPFRMTASKSGLSTSFGVKGARVTRTANGKTRARFSIPGTGIGYTVGGGKKRKAKGRKKNAGGGDTLGIMGGLLAVLIFLLCAAVIVVLIPVVLVALAVYLIYSYLKIPSLERQGFGSHVASQFRRFKAWVEADRTEDEEEESEGVEQ